MFKALASSPDWKLLEPSTSYFKVFELSDPQPSYYWEPSTETRNAEAKPTRWDPAMREFSVRSPAGGRFVFAEQNFPGWRATIDGKDTAISPHDRILQSVEVPPGEHTVRFAFQSRGLTSGAGLTLTGLAILFLAVLYKPRVL